MSVGAPAVAILALVTPLTLMADEILLKCDKVTLLQAPDVTCRTAKAIDSPNILVSHNLWLWRLTPEVPDITAADSDGLHLQDCAVDGEALALGTRASPSCPAAIWVIAATVSAIEVLLRPESTRSITYTQRLNRTVA